MKSILFGLALLCALPGCCGMWKCEDKEPKKKSCKPDCNNNDRKADKKMEKKGNSYKK